MENLGEWEYDKINIKAWRIQIMSEVKNHINTIPKYSRLSLSRLRLSRTTAYLEEKIWSMFKSNIR